MKITMRHIDNGWYEIAASVAGKLAKQSPLGRLPRHGYCCDVQHNGKKWILERTVTFGRLVWSIRLHRESYPPLTFPLKISDRPLVF